MAGDPTDAIDRPEDEEAERANERFRTIFEHSHDPIMIVDPETESIVDVNPRACEMLGYDRKELLSLSPADIHPNSIYRAHEFIDTVYEEGAGWTNELTCRTKDGTQLHSEIAASVIQLDGRNCMLAIVRDITERKARERELERQNERLDEFARVVSHDLRNPLEMLNGSIALAEKTCDQEYFEHAREAIDRMERMIDDLLTLARAGETISEPGPVDLAGLVENCWEAMATTDATLVVGTERTIRADRDRLRHLVENLVRNAVEHASTSPQPEADDTVERGSTSPQPEADDTVERGSTSPQPEADDAVEHGDDTVTVTIGDLENGFYVADDGPGIAPEEREQVFEAGHSTLPGGTGFGLSIVNEIADAHGWEVVVTDSDDGGARFEITGVEVT